MVTKAILTTRKLIQDFFVTAFVVGMFIFAITSFAMAVQAFSQLPAKASENVMNAEDRYVQRETVKRIEVIDNKIDKINEFVIDSKQRFVRIEANSEYANTIQGWILAALGSLLFTSLGVILNFIYSGQLTKLSVAGGRRADDVSVIKPVEEVTKTKN